MNLFSATVLYSCSLLFQKPFLPDVEVPKAVPLGIEIQRKQSRLLDSALNSFTVGAYEKLKHVPPAHTIQCNHR